MLLNAYCIRFSSLFSILSFPSLPDFYLLLLLLIISVLLKTLWSYYLTCGTLFKMNVIQCQMCWNSSSKFYFYGNTKWLRPSIKICCKRLPPAIKNKKKIKLKTKDFQKENLAEKSLFKFLLHKNESVYFSCML